MNTTGLARLFLIVALLGFFLPFFSVSCSGQRLMSLTGANMVTGVTVESPGSALEGAGMNSVGEEREIDPDPFVIAAGLLGIVGLVGSFRSGKASRAVPSGAGFLAAVSLLILYGRATSEASGAPVSINVEFGFWLTLAGFTGAALAGAWPYLSRDSGESAQSSAASRAPGPEPPPESI